MLPRTAIQSAILSILISGAILAQPTPGLPPFASFSGGPFDTVNNANLNVHFGIPVVSKAGRGMSFSYTLTSDSSVWSPASASGSSVWTPVGNWGWAGVTQAETGFITYLTTQSSCTPNGNTWYYWNNYNGFNYHDAFGTSHLMAVSASTWSSSYPCGGGVANPMTGTAVDGSGYSMTVGTTSGSLYASVSRSDGALMNPPLQQGSGAGGSVTDSNGNQISATYNGGATTFTDTLGTTALTVSGLGTQSSPLTFGYTNPQSGTSSYKMNYAPKTVQTAFGCPGVAEYGPTNGVNLVTEIDLADDNPQGVRDRYTISYEATPGYPNNVTGRIASVTLPTGGTITYSYLDGSHNITCADGSTSKLTRTTPDGQWTYAHAEPVSPSPWTTTITDPASNVTLLSFQGAQTAGKPASNAIYEVQRTVNMGTSGTLTVNTCYNGTAIAQCTTAAVNTPITQVAVFKTLPSLTGNTVQSETASVYDPFGFPTEVDEYDYGTSSSSPQPGSLVRKTTTTYAFTSGPVNRPQQIFVYNLSGLTAQTTYSYGTTGTLPTSGTPQHVSVSGPRGNLTAVSRWVVGSTALSQTLTYYDTGNVYTAIDVNGAVTTSTYGSGISCGNSFVTGTALPLSLSTQATWNCTGGVQTSATDANSKTTTTYYNDANYWRPTSVQDPSGATTTISYATSPSFATESALNFNGSTSTVDARATLDGLGRPHIGQKKQGQGSTYYDSVETDYNSVGLPWRVTVPYQGAAGGTASVWPSTVAYYNALSQPTQAVKVDHTGAWIGWTNYTYNQNDVLVDVEPVGSGDANAKKRQLEYDGLGRLTSVCELSSAAAPGSCGQNVPQTGFWTKYTYDTLNDLLTVTQNAQSGSTQTRTFTYDGLGRMASEKNPETAQAATSYTYDSDGICGTSNGDLVKRVDPVGNVTCYAYDALHRLTSVTYPVGSYSGVTPAKYYVYDSATVNGTAMANAKGHLAEAYTGSSKTTDLGFSYSARGEVTDAWQKSPNSGGWYHVTAGYWSTGPAGLLNTLTVPGITSMFTYNPDGEGRIYSVQAGSSYLVSRTQYNDFDSGGPWRPQVVTLGSGDSDTVTFDFNSARVTEYKATINGSSAKGDLSWNGNGSLQQLQITDPFKTANNQTCAYARDDLSRISKVDCGTNNWGQTFGYDAFGNITKAVITNPSHSGNPFTPTYSPNNTNQISGGGFNYDANGNLIQEGTGGNSYTWDAEGKLHTFNGGTALVYDALGRRVEQTNSSGTREILYGPGGNKLALMNGQSSVQAFIPLAGGATAIYSNGSLAWYRHPDWLGSSRIASYPTQQNPYYDGEASYAPFGESPTETGNIDHNFTGQNQDLTSVLYDFPAREYNPGEGRWISPDPAGVAAVDPTLPQSWNRYAYVLNDPMTNVDPTGQFVCAYALGDMPDEGAADNEQDCVDGGGVWTPDVGDPGYVRWFVTDTEKTDQLPAFGQGVVNQLEDESDALGTVVDVLGGTDATVVALPMAVGGAGAAVNGIARLAGSYYATMPGATAAVLGAYKSVYNPGYLNVAEGWANALDIPRGVYNFLNAFGEGWTANQQFINNVAAAGQQVYLSEGPLGNAGLYEGFASELAYMESIGLGPNQWTLVHH